MQNAFASKGGLLDLAGIDVEPAGAAVAKARVLADAARSAGIASNVCGESALRDAVFREYWPVMIEDATLPGGPPEIQQATIYNVTTFFGWVSTAYEVTQALAARGRGR